MIRDKMNKTDAIKCAGIERERKERGRKRDQSLLTVDEFASRQHIHATIIRACKTHCNKIENIIMS